MLSVASALAETSSIVYNPIAVYRIRYRNMDFCKEAIVCLL